MDRDEQGRGKPSSGRNGAAAPGKSKVAAAAAASGQPLPRGYEWAAGLIKTSNGFAGHIANAQLILANDVAWRAEGEPERSIIAWDDFRSCVTLRGAAPWGEGYRPPGAFGQGYEWTDVDDSRCAIWLATKWNVRVSEGVAAAAVLTCAQSAPFHPVRDYLEACRAGWDGKPRIDAFLPTYFGAAPSPYHGAVGRFFLIGACARIYQPGALLQCVPIAEGLQGAGKSRGTAALCPDPRWFYDSDLELGNKDAYQNIRGKWLIELPELDSLSRVDYRRIKAFFSSRIDTYRPSYGRRSVAVPRQCGFIGTTNQGRDHPYLQDETGGRRFYPFEVRAVDVEAIARDRDQIWGEAATLYKSGAPWHPTDPALLGEFKRQVEARYKVDAWEDRFRAWLAAQAAPPERMSVLDVLADVFRLTMDRMDDAANRRAGRVLTRMGWVRRQARVKERGGKAAWFYFPPESAPAADDAGEELGGEELGAAPPPPGQAALPLRAREPGDDDDDDDD